MLCGFNQREQANACQLICWATLSSEIHTEVEAGYSRLSYALQSTLHVPRMYQTPNIPSPPPLNCRLDSGGDQISSILE